MATILKIPFQGTKKDMTRTLSLADPKEGLKKAEVEACQQEAIAKKALVMGTGFAVAALEPYTVETTKTVLA